MNLAYSIVLVFCCVSKSPTGIEADEKDINNMRGAIKAKYKTHKWFVYVAVNGTRYQ